MIATKAITKKQPAELVHQVVPASVQGYNAARKSFFIGAARGAPLTNLCELQRSPAVYPQIMRQVYFSTASANQTFLSRRCEQIPSIWSRRIPGLRAIQTRVATIKDQAATLAAQRLKRPTSPHITIYEPQITWYLSALNRITGVALSSIMYLFGIFYLFSPLFGLTVTSTGMAAAFGALPWIAKFTLKSLIAFPFAFHGWNGLRQ